MHVQLPELEIIHGVSNIKNYYWTVRAGDLGLGCTFNIRRRPTYRSFAIARIAAAGFTPPSPQPCQAWHSSRLPKTSREAPLGQRAL
jgi:hypothetical protein